MGRTRARYYDLRIPRGQEGGMWEHAFFRVKDNELELISYSPERRFKTGKGYLKSISRGLLEKCLRTAGLTRRLSVPLQNLHSNQ